MILALLAPVWAEDTAEPTPAATDPVEVPAGPDRSGRPPLKEPVPLDLEDLEVHRLANGLEVHHIRVARLRDVFVELDWWRGTQDLQAHDPDVIGLMSDLWGVASEKYDAKALSELEDLNDMEVRAGVRNHSASVTLEVPLEHLDVGLDLMADVALHPTFPKREVKLAQEETERWYTSEGPKSPGTVAYMAVDWATIPADHPYGRRPDLDDLVGAKHKALPPIHADVIATRPASLLVVGDVGWDVLEPALTARFGGLPATDGERDALLDIPPLPGTRVLAVDMPASEQAAIRVRSLAPAVAHADAVPLRATTWALGGHFLARFNKNLREDKGWTYGVRSFYSAGRTYGTFQVGVDVPADKLAAAVGELQKELDAVLTDGVTPEELEAWWRGSVKDYNDTRGTIGSASSFYDALYTDQEAVADRLGRVKAVKDVTVDQAREVAGRWLGPDVARVWVVVGPREQLEAGFAALGWEAEWVTAEDAVLGRLPGDPAGR
ncbi:MAG: insulinase family protein [Alphaproteobacteria bacterium]|nr:insulinase family protein [Alphaproteobacteria bacterium]MCB9691306.1 insulinase family protein [Alphaproteobacteria bacterium]